MKDLLVFDFGGTSVKYGMFANNKLSEIKSFLTPATWEETKEQMDAIKAEYEADHHIEGIAFSFPGCVDNKNGEILGASAIKYIHHFPIKKELEARYNLPISMENDANCAALAECWIGAAKGFKDVLFVIVGTGIGGGVIVDGKLQLGAHLFGGELGFAILGEEEDGTPITLSGHGTAVRMAARYCERKGVAEGTFSGKDVFELADQGDAPAAEEVALFYKYLSRGLYNMQMSIDPDMIVIGGGLSANPAIVQKVEDHTNELITARIKDFTAKIVPCKYKNDANLLGAVKNFFVEHEVAH
ncbi:MAG: ROK family protein [Turicibacter sp.]|nr:ROK family protein [Turicibacter sp.]